MSLEHIKLQTNNINEMGRNIIRMYNLLKKCPDDVQKYYAGELLDLISEYYDFIDELKKNVKEVNAGLKVPNITLKRLEKSLGKFK